MKNPLGAIFGEAIISFGKSGRSYFGQQTDGNIYASRIYFLAILLFLGLAVIIFRLFSITIVSGSQYKKLSQENRIKEITLRAPRGIIYDRNRNPLVRNIPVFITTGGEKYYQKPENVNEFLIEDSTREYIYGPVFGHVLGYIGEVGPEEFKEQSIEVNNDQLFELHDTVGKMGIEKSYDSLLRGKNGKEMFEVDAQGTYIRTLGKIEPVAGRNLTLALDKNLQEKLQELLGDKKGAVIATDPNTGGILALYSSPEFDPNKILKEEGLESIFNHPDKPLFNRAISGLYPPGSTFKLITALAGLESGSIAANTTFEDTGVIKINEYSYANWYFTQYGRREGIIDLVSAIQRSNDIYFYKVGEYVGIDTLANWAKMAGVGVRLGIDIEGEERGFMPNRQWKKKELNENWFLGDTYIAAIGQGHILVTPLHVNFWTNIIANQGKLCRPYLMQNKKSDCRDIGVKQAYLDIIKQGMKQACQPGGTGWPLFNFTVTNELLTIEGLDFWEVNTATSSAAKLIGVTTACKTGTAEFGDAKGRTHAWFTVFAPVENPQISVTVLVEEGGEGSSVAAPIAKELLKTWFER